MRTLTKRIYLIGLTMLLTLSLLFGGIFAFAQTKNAKAASALETEFTNNRNN